MGKGQTRMNWLADLGDAVIEGVERVGHKRVDIHDRRLARKPMRWQAFGAIRETVDRGKIVHLATGTYSPMLCLSGKRNVRQISPHRGAARPQIQRVFFPLDRCRTPHARVLTGKPG